MKKKSFTLIEVLISSAILLVLLAGTVSVLYVGNTSWQTDLGMLDLQQQARQVMTGMVNEIRQARISSGISITNAGTNIEFSVPGSASSIKYSLNTGKIVREHPAGTTKILANDISNVTFCCWHDNACDSTCSAAEVLQIQLKAAKTTRQRQLVFPAMGNLTEKIRLRNE